MAFVGNPLLYVNMVVHTDRLNEDLVSAISVPARHQGLCQVRTLRIESEYSRYGQNYDYFDRSESTLSLCSLLRVMSRNALTRFE